MTRRIGKNPILGMPYTPSKSIDTTDAYAYVAASNPLAGRPFPSVANWIKASWADDDRFPLEPDKEQEPIDLARDAGLRHPDPATVFMRRTSFSLWISHARFNRYAKACNLLVGPNKSILFYLRPGVNGLPQPVARCQLPGGRIVDRTFRDDADRDLAEITSAILETPLHVLKEELS